jgi:hypothetical protein
MWWYADSLAIDSSATLEVLFSPSSLSRRGSVDEHRAFFAAWSATFRDRGVVRWRTWT